MATTEADSAAWASGPILGPDQQILRFEPAETTSPRPSSQIGTPYSTVVTLHAFGRSFTLDLRPSGIVDDPGSLYEGVVRGETDSRVAVSLDGATVDGLVRVGSEIYFFEPAGHFDPEASSNATVSFRLSDISSNVPGAGMLRQRLRRRSGRGSSEQRLGSTFPALLEIALVADNEYALKHGLDTESRMLTIFNLVNAIFLDQISLRFRVVHQQVFRTSNDPFSEFNSSNLFNNFKNATTEFGNWRRGQSGPAKTAGLGHLFSDRTLGLTSGGAGFGFTNTLCSASRGVAITTTPFFDSTSLHALIIEHELGHNFGADHDGASGSCVSAPPGHIMAPAATGTTFSTCSKAIITARAEAASCVTDNVPITTTTSTTSTTSTTLPPVPCSRPVVMAAEPTATDCLFILKAAVGSVTCSPACMCAPKGSLPITATDALVCLKRAVGGQVPLNCPC